MITRKKVFDLNASDVVSFLNEFDSVDWKTEPTESMKTLCKQRAQQLRDSYDYLILYNSGGSDSTTVLNAFLDNNIFVDEVVTVSYEGIQAACLDGKKAESDLIRKSYKGKFNKVVLRLDDIIRFLKNDTYLDNSPNFTGQMHSFSRFNINYLEKFGFCEPLNRKGSTCHLYGEADPFVWKEATGFYAGMDIKRKFNASNYAGNVGFFTDANFPQLHIKQCHLVAKILKKNPSAKIRDIKPIIRDEFYSMISPRKCADDPQFIINNKELYTEPTILLNKYSSAVPEFTDLYINSAHKQQFNITQAIKTVTTKYKKQYFLFS